MADIVHTIRLVASAKAAIDEVRKYQDQLVGCAQTVEKHTATLSGDRMLKGANEWTIAVGKLGGATNQLATSEQLLAGVSKLTESEKAKLNRTVTEAIAKYQALGQTAPKAMTELATATAGASKQSESWGSQLSKVAGILGVGLSGAALVGLAKDLMRTGDELKKLADRTGMTVTEIQRLQYIGGQTGVTLDEFSSAVAQLQNRLASGDKSAVEAVKALGLNFAELRNAGTYQALDMIAASTAKIPDPMKQTQIQMDLFGRGGVAILPALKDHFKALGDAAPVMSEKTVYALDRAGDALERFKMIARVWAAESYNVAREGFERLIAAAYRAVASLFDVTARIVDMAAKIPGATTAMNALGVSADGLRTSAQWYRDAATGMTIETERVAVSARQAVPTITALEQATTRTTAAARSHADTVSRQAVELDRLRDRLREVELGTLATGKVLGAVLEDMTPAIDPIIQKFFELQQRIKAFELDGAQGLDKIKISVEAIKPSIEDLGRSAGRFFEGMNRGVKGLVEGLTGGEGLAGFFSNIGFGITQQLGSILTGGLSSLITLGVGIVWEGLKKIGGFFRDLFSGPSADELAGREVVARFEANLDSMLTDAQRLEAGNESWKATVIAIRDAYIAQGFTVEQAMADAERLWASSKLSAEESRRVIEEITRNMQGLGSAAQSAFNQIPREINVAINADWNIPNPPDITESWAGEGFQRGTRGRFFDFGAGTPVMLHGRERVVTEREGRAEAVSTTEMESRLSAIERLLRNQPNMMALALKSALTEVA